MNIIFILSKKTLFPQLMSPVNKYGGPEGSILHLREHTVLLFISSQKDLNVVSL